MRWLSLYGDQLPAAEVRPKPLGNVDAAVLALVILEDRHEPASCRQCAVERRDGLGLPINLLPNGESSRLEGRTVRRGRHLHPPFLAWQPGFAVELPGSRAAEISRRRVDDAVGKLNLGKHLLFEIEQTSMLVLRIVRGAVGEHLHLVELVDADDSAGVLAVRAGLPPVAGRPSRVALRAVRQVDDLIGMEPGQRHFGGADQIEVVRLQVIDLVGVRAEEARPRHHLRLHEGRRDRQGETVGLGKIRCRREQGEFEPRADAGEIVKTRPGHFCSPSHVDGANALGKIEVVFHGEIERRNISHVLEDDIVVLSAGGHPIDDDVRDQHANPLVFRVGLRGGVLELLHLRRQFLSLGEDGGTLLGGCLPDRARQSLLLGARLLRHLQSRATGLVCSQEVIYQGLIGAAGPLRCSDSFGVLTDVANIDHVTSLARRGYPFDMTWESWLAIAALLVALSALFLALSNRQAIATRLAKSSEHGQWALEHDADNVRSKPVVVIYNPVKNINVPTFKALVERMAAEAGYQDVRFSETTVEEPGSSQAKQAVSDGAGLVIAAGGDGTVRAVAAGLAKSGTALGIVALGTGNLLARNLDLPISSTEAMVRTALTGGTHAMDVGFLQADPLTESELLVLANEDPDALSVPDGDHAFAVIAGLGFDAAMVGDADAELKSKIGWVAYVASAVRNLTATKIHAKITAGAGHEVPIDARSIMFANCGKLPGGVVLAPDARLDDGWIDLVVIDTKGGLVGWADLVRRMGLAGMGVTNDGLPMTGMIDLRKTSRASVVTESPARVQVDGDVLGYASTVRARVEPGGLLVRF